MVRDQINWQDEEKQSKKTKHKKHNNIWWTANTNNVNITCVFLHTTGGYDEPKMTNKITYIYIDHTYHGRCQI